MSHFQKCERCGKNMIVSTISLSEVRRAAVMMGDQLCRCEDAPIPDTIKAIVAMLTRGK
jgi:hypothetical protein